MAERAGVGPQARLRGRHGEPEQAGTLHGAALLAGFGPLVVKVRVPLLAPMLTVADPAAGVLAVSVPLPAASGPVAGHAPCVAQIVMVPD